MSSRTAPPPAGPLTTVQWLICVIAAIGFAFDIYELLMLPLILGPAAQELLGVAPGSKEFLFWRGILFFAPAFIGGIVGMYGGVLTDRLGRRFVLTWSIILYAVSAFLAGFSTNIWMLLFFRCTTFIGVCVEFVAAVAWLAELFPNPTQREKVLGYTQAFSSIGGLLVAIVSEYISTKGVAESFPAIGIPGLLAPLLGQIKPEFVHAPWRYTLMSGLIPALPLIVIRPFLPESPVWAQKRASGTLRRPSFSELFAPQLRQTTLVTTVMFACSYGAAFGAIQQAPEIVKGLTDVQQKVKSAVDELKLPPEAERAEALKRRTRGQIEQKVASQYTKMQEVGGLVGRFLLAFLAIRVLSRRNLMRIFLGPGLLIVPAIFFFFLSVPNTKFAEIDLSSIYLGTLPITTMSIGMFLAGLFTVAQFSFWGNYLPLVYPVHLRGTGESFAANIGGRMFGTAFALVTTTIVSLLPDTLGSTPQKFAVTAGGVAAFVYLMANIFCSSLPEPEPGAMEE